MTPCDRQKCIRVLLIEDVATDAQLEVRELKRAGLMVESQVVDTEEGFLDALAAFEPDVIISDFSMPHFDGMAALALARDRCPDIPFIFVSGTIGEEYAVRALKNGATDYVLKSNLVRLPAAIERAIQETRERAARRRSEAELSAAKERLERALETSGVALWDNDVSTSEVYLSKEWSLMLGGTAQPTVTSPRELLAIVHTEDRERVRSVAVSLMREDIADYEIEHRVRKLDGEWMWILSRGKVIERAADGKALRVIGTNMDITARKRHEQHLARLSRIRDVTSAINSALVRIRQREELFSEVCRIAVEVGGFLGARVGLLDPETRALEWVAIWGPTTLMLRGMQVSADPTREEGRGIAGQALRNGQPHVWNDVAGEPDVRHRDDLLAAGVRAAASFPLVVEGRVIGILGLHASEAGLFDDEEVRLLKELTANIAFGLELMEKQARLDYVAYYDALTELPNRTLLRERITQAMQVARRTETRLALMMLDIERFKGINDTLGQHAGDRILQLVAQRLRDATADKDRLARFGGDQFAVMFPEVRDTAHVARAVAATVAQFLEIPFDVEGRELQLGVKAGIAVFPDDGTDAEALLRNTEASLKRAKETGEHYLFYAPQMNVRLAEQVELEQRLRRAVDHGELFLHFQPVVELASRRIIGLEALLRWTDPDGKLVSPARFVPVLEETGLIFEAGEQALATAASIYRAWKTAGINPPRIAVNVSSLQLRKTTFVEDIRSALDGSGDSGVDLEITESLLMENVEESIAKLRNVRDAGINIALDDFGTGYSSLAYLSRLPIDALKIDRGFIHGVTENANDTTIVSTIISLAQALRLKVIAEGVETEAQAQLLRLLRCDQMQGYLFSPPVPKDNVEQLLRAPVS